MSEGQPNRGDAQRPLLEVKDLAVQFSTERGQLHAVDGVSFLLPRGGTLGIVGESGCGKSVMSLAIMGLVPSPPGKVVGGEILFGGRDLNTLPERELRKLRGSQIAMIFQEPMSALNPVFTVGHQIGEALRLHQGLSRKEAKQRSIELLSQVGISSPETRVDAYPHELSGGMRQRVMIAMAISCKPALLIADEPTTALDVTIQAQVLELLSTLQQELEMGIMLITHDLGVVAEFVDHVLVMYAGRAVEYATTQELFREPLHPYTKGLLASVPGSSASNEPNKPSRRLATIEGMVPDLANLPTGCRFRGRCKDAIERCSEHEPETITLADGRQVACFVAAERMAAETNYEEERS